MAVLMAWMAALRSNGLVVDGGHQQRWPMLERHARHRLFGQRNTMR